MGSDFRTAALQPSLSMIPTLQQAPYARSTHLDLENFDPSTISSPQAAMAYHDHGQTKRIDCYDSGHSASCGSSQQSETKKRLEEQKNNILVEVSSGTIFVEEPTHIEKDKPGTQVTEDEAEVSLDVPRSLSGKVLTRNGSFVGIGGPENAMRIHTFQSPELSPPLTIRNLLDLEGAEDACLAEPSVPEGSSVISRTPSQVTSVSRASSRRSAPTEKTPPVVLRRYRGQNSRSEQLSAREAQVFEERCKEIQQFMREEERRASLDTTLSSGFYQQPSESETSLRNPSSQSYTHHRHSTLSLPALQGSMSYITLPVMSIHSGGDSPSPNRAEIHYAQSMQNLGSMGMSPVHYDPRFSRSLADQLHYQFPERSTSRAHVDARSISSTGRVDVGDQASIRSHQSKTPSIASSLQSAQQRRSPNPSPRHLRYPGGPTPIDARNNTAMNSNSSGSDSYYRPFTGFSGEYAHSQRPHSVIYPASGYPQTDADFVSHDAYTQLAGYPHQLGHQHPQSTPNFGRPASIASTSSYTHGPNPSPYIPPGGPLITDVMTPSAPPRGQRRDPKDIPKLQCAANVNMAVSWDANGEPIGYHYENPEDSAIQRWQGGVHAVEELKKLKSGRAGNMRSGRGERRRERPPANWRSPGRLHGTIHEEETFVPDGRGLYGYVARGQAEGRLRNNGRRPSVS